MVRILVRYASGQRCCPFHNYNNNNNNNNNHNE